MVQKLLETIGIDLSNGARITELDRFQEQFREYKIVVYLGLSCDNSMFAGQVDSTRRFNILYVYIKRHYHVIANLTAAVARRYVFKSCHKSCARDVTHACDQTCSDCLACHPCAFADVRIHCLECNRHFRSQTSFANDKQSTKQNRSVCEAKQCCAMCGWFVTRGNHECNNRYCDNY